jgi:hypothetical protein
MKKIIQLTESDLSRIVRRVISEQNSDELDEGIFDSILKAFRGGGKKVVSAASKMSTTPLFSQISHDIRQLITKIPQKVKVGPKLEGVFKKTSYDIKSLEGSIARYERDMNGFGIAEIYSRQLSNAVRQPKGSVVNLKEVYTDAHLLKKELENIKHKLPRPKEGGILNKNKNYQSELNKHYNFLLSELGSINKFISEIDNLLKEVKIKK